MIIDKEFQTLIPALTEEEYKQLEENLLQNGIREPLSVWGDILIDGHNRYEIAQKHNLPYTTKAYEFDSRNDVIFWIIKNQFGRRNISNYDRALLAIKLKPVIAEKAKENQLSALKQNTVSQISVERKPIDTQKELAKMANVSHDTIAKVEKIESKAAPEIKQKVKSGELSINQAYQQVKREDKISVVREKEKEVESIKTSDVDIFTTDKRYNIIYADPAWDYFSGGNKNQSLHYSTMTIDEICALPVKNIADDNCILFLWVTSPILDKSFEVIKAWGFTYSTIGFIWVKENKNVESPFIGLGSWTRANGELCLIATKGSITRIDNGISQIIQSPISEHSKKPDIVRSNIERLVGKLPRIELFSRQDVDGWDRWGNGI